MKKSLLPRLLLVIVMPALVGYGLVVSTAGLKGVSNRESQQRPSPTGSEQARAWILNQRAYPGKTIPAGAMERAWRSSMQAVALESQLPNDVTVGDQWTNIGPAPVMGGQIIGSTANPRVTGRIVDIAVDPTQPSTHWFVASASGGIWETADSGNTWTPKTDAVASLVTNTISIAPSSPQTLFTGITDITGNGMGLLKSTDGGANWSQQATSVFGGRNFFFVAVKVHPTHPNIVLAMTYRGSQQANGGFFKSIDGGATFPTHSLTGAGTTLAINPANFSQQYAAIRNGFYDEDPHPEYNGVFRSMDMGSTWAMISGPWNTLLTGGLVKVAIAPTDPNTLYIVVPGSGIWKTQNAWALPPSWTAVPPTIGGSTNADVIMVDPTDANVLYAGGFGFNTAGGEFTLQRLNNSTWTQILNSTHVDQHALAAGGSTILLGNDGGFWTSTNQGGTWTNKNSNLGVIQFYAGSQHPTDATAALGGSQDNGTELWGGSVAWIFEFSGDGGCSAFSKLDPTTWLVSAQYLDIYRMTGSGSSFQWAQTGLDRSGSGFIAPIRRSPSSDIILAGSNNLWRLTDFFTAPTPTWVSNGPEMGIDISAIAFAPSNIFSQTYAFGAGGEMRLTTNGGANWSDLDPSGAVPNRYVKAIAFHPTTPSTIYVALSGFNASTPGFPGHIFKTTNSGATWSDVSPPADVPMNALAIDPVNPNTIFAGADLGVWKSSTGGTTWTFMGPERGMPNVPVLDLVFSPVDGRLVAYTHGRGAFKLNVGSLQVTITPPGAVTAGAKWKVDNGVYQASGTIVTGLAPGNHTVSFGPASGFTPPASQVVTISLNQTTTTTGVYAPGSRE